MTLLVSTPVARRGLELHKWVSELGEGVGFMAGGQGLLHHLFELSSTGTVFVCVFSTRID